MNETGLLTEVFQAGVSSVICGVSGVVGSGVATDGVFMLDAAVIAG